MKKEIFAKKLNNSICRQCENKYLMLKKIPTKSIFYQYSEEHQLKLDIETKIFKHFQKGLVENMKYLVDMLGL